MFINTIEVGAKRWCQTVFSGDQRQDEEQGP